MTSYEQLAQVPLGDNILAQIAATARDVLEARDAVAEAEKVLKEKQAELRALQEDILPELMKEAGQEKLTTIDGLVVSVKENVRGQPTKENETAAFKWLRSNGQGGIIKAKVEADLGKGDAEKTRKVIETLGDMGVRAAAKETVHWQTLGAMVRELLARGEPVPLELLGVSVWTQADVKPKG